MTGKGKGSEFERRVCKMLSKWIQGTEKPYLFWRGAGSGSLVGSSANLSSDIHSINEKSAEFCSIFSIECKKGYPGASFDKFLNNLSSDPIAKAWGQVCADSAVVGKSPMLIFSKKNNPVIWLCLNNKFSSHYPYRYFMVDYNKDRTRNDLMFVFSFTEYLSFMKPEDLIKGAKEYAS